MPRTDPNIFLGRKIVFFLLLVRRGAPFGHQNGDIMQHRRHIALAHFRLIAVKVHKVQIAAGEVEQFVRRNYHLDIAENLYF